MKSISTIFYNAFCNTLKGLFLILLCVFFSNPLSAQWQAYTPQLSDTVGAADLRIAPGDAQTAWCAAMKYKVTYDTYNWVPTENLFFTKTSDGGNTWTGGEIPMGIEPFLSNISPISANTAWVSGLDADYSNYVLRTEDGGATWTRFLEDGFTDPTSYVDLVHFWDEQNGIAVGDPTPGPGHPEPYFEIYRTEDGGQNWSRVPADNIPAPVTDEYGSSGFYTATGNTIWFWTIEFVNFSIIRLFRSNDRGLHWEAFDVAGMRQVSFADSLNAIYAERGANNQIQFRRSVDGGATWTLLNGSPGDEFLSSIAYVPQSLVMVAAQRANNLAAPFYTRISQDLGQTWMEIGNSAENAAAMRFNSPTTGYAGEWQPVDHPTRMYKYNGSPLSGLFSGLVLDAEITISPNPTPDVVQVRVETVLPTEFVLLLNDAQGRLIERRELDKTAEGNARFDLSRLPTGMYTLTVSSPNGYRAQTVCKY
jgi:photosystem II stability/assembly factor-like uncharacterized protein